MPPSGTKIFIIDDNVLIRFALTQLVNQDPDLLLVGDVAASNDLIRQVEHAKPDLIILDIPLPREKGIKYLKSLHKFHLPVIVFTKDDAAIAKDLIPLLEAGMVDIVLKPADDGNIVAVKEQLLYTIRRNTQTLSKAKHRKSALTYLDPQWVVAIGSSTGGPEALMEIMPTFPSDFSAGLTLVQHMPPDFTPRFAERLGMHSNVAIKHAADGDVVKDGIALMAPGGYHMTFVEKTNGPKRQATVKLTQDPPQWGLRPTVDQMLVTLAPIYGKKLIAIILTGMGQDGVIGTRAVKRCGGHTIVQNQATSVVFGMAQEVIKNHLADEVLPLKQIPYRAMELVGV